MRYLKFNLAPWFKILSVLVFLLIVVGGMVRNLGAGLSCPDWPLCQGRVIPVFDIRVFAEYFHRLFAASVSVLTLALAIKIFRDKELRAKLGGLMALALLLLASQVVLGGLTVLQLLKSEIVTLHLATGTLFFAAILTMALRTKQSEPLMKAIPYESQKKWGWVAVCGTVAGFVLYGQIILGGIVSSHGAGLACPDFPKCLGEWWPGLSGVQGLHFIHRLGAATASVTVLFFVYQVLSSSLPKGIRRLALGITVLLLTQISLGVGNVLLHLPVAMSVAHLAVAEALFALILMSTYEIRRFQLR
jgi:cytochrome c oxidase assembly protein subunit 15